MTQIPAQNTDPDGIDPILLDIVSRNSDFILYYGESPLMTPGGHECAHTSSLILEQIYRELWFKRSRRTDSVNAFTLLCWQKDYIESDADPILNAFGNCLDRDPLVMRMREHTTAADKQNPPAGMDLEQLSYSPLMIMFGSSWGTVKAFHNLLQEHGLATLDCISQTPQVFTQRLCEIYQQRCAEEKAGILTLNAAHEAGILLPLLLVMKRLTPAQYAMTLFGVHRSQPLSSSLPQLPVTCPDWKRMEETFSLLRGHAAEVMEYLFDRDRATHNRAGSVRELIALGEGFSMEFKSSLRWNVKADKNDSAIEHACLKTIAAFLNSSGGTLLIGVKDDGAIEGIEIDRFVSVDKFALHFWNLVKASLGQDVSAFIRTRFEAMNDKTVFQVDCTRSHKPVFLQQKGFEEEFYIRVGPSSARLGIQEALNYIAYQFGGTPSKQQVTS